MFSHAPFSSAHRYAHRPACRPGSPFRSAPRSISPLGLSCLGSFLFYRFIRFSSRPLVILSCSLAVFIAIPSGLAPIHGGEGSRQREAAVCGLFFSRAPFSPAHYHSPRHQVLIIGGGRPIVVGSTGRSRQCPLIISSGSSHSSPLSHLITERRRWCLSYFKQATTAWRSLGSSSHPIISSHPRHGASRPPSRLMRLGRASRPHIPGHQR